MTAKEAAARFVQTRMIVVALLAAAAIGGALPIAATKALAHKDHHARQGASSPAAPSAPSRVVDPVPANHDPAMPGHAGKTPTKADAGDARQSFGARLVDWVGRLHPMLVHFPIAFIPAALFTAIAGRRRAGFAKPVQFLVVTAGVTAPFAMLTGWLSGGSNPSADGWVMQSHRWLGTGIGVAALVLGVFALKRPEKDRGFGMIVALSVVTAAIVVQGWFGGALVHGVDHLNW